MSGRLIALLAIFAALSFASHGFARPGGGSSYSGGSRSSGSSSSSSRSSGSSSTGSSSRSSSGSSTSSGSGTSSGSSSRSTSTGTSTGSGSTGTSTGSGSTDTGTPPSSSGDVPTDQPRPQPKPAPLFFVLLFLIVLIGVPVLAIVVLYRVLTGIFRKNWSTSAAPKSYAPPPPVERPLSSVDEAIRALQGRDEAFSRALLEDFLYSLFAEAQTHRPKLVTLSAYLGPNVRAVYDRRPVDAVRDVVVGAMRITSVGVDRAQRKVSITVEFDANYTEVRGGQQQAYYVGEEWKLVRSVDAKSREPERATAITCPHCGAPLDTAITGKCAYCGHESSHGLDDWFVEDVSVLGREERGPMLTGDTEEVGTDLPTIVDANVNGAWRALGERDPSVTWNSFTTRVAHVFQAFYEGWSNRDLTRVRPYLSDALFGTQQYWIKAYREAGLRNIAGDAKITSIQVARVTSDKFFDAVTVRVYATCFDHTVNDAGQIVSGSRQKPRVYSEYWTFLRGRGAKGTTHGPAECPNCGAPLDVDMAGACKHCGAKLTRGDFDFVLSRIEQDESYR